MLSKYQVLQLIKKYSKVFYTNLHSELEEIGTLTHAQLESIISEFLTESEIQSLITDEELAIGKVNNSTLAYGSGTTSIEFELTNDVRYNLHITNVSEANFNLSIPPSVFSTTIILVITSDGDKTINWDSELDATNWIDGTILTSINANTKYVVSINTGGTSKSDIIINYVEIPLV